MQACSYDAIYVDPDRNTAAKCHFCAIAEVGLEPACAAVCPERAIIAGDLDQPDSQVAQLLARESVRVRKPEQGTKPKVFLDQCPNAARRQGSARPTRAGVLTVRYMLSGSCAICIAN
jgi:Fe-S-cluster-containing dehydrogenase component